ncbi:protein-L-isoaspartate O-methyltransferase family protein [Fodinicurvata sediminis]|uniref:protein-L-isoaspartate O-methyltransferase family protein n=1 Tax=Fodinicurvata sediminis TaxID=1121832 RepID=UPI0003B3D16F|nr:protein-L-isoaspartate O-methyltransferase [Fodinicurvata sediminis]
MDYAYARLNMVESQLRTNRVFGERLLDAFETLPRELFVPENIRSISYVDEDLHIGNGRYLMEPMVLGRLLQAADIQESDVALDIGCATGYATAILARLCSTAVGLESDPGLVETANNLLSRMEISNAVVVQGDLAAGYPRQAPYNVVLVNGGIEELPAGLTDQLAEGGRLMCVTRPDSVGIGRARLYRKDDGVVSNRILFDASTPILEEFRAPERFVF